jgi:hypothetical protein
MVNTTAPGQVPTERLNLQDPNLYKPLRDPVGNTVGHEASTGIDNRSVWRGISQEALRQHRSTTYPFEILPAAENHPALAFKCIVPSEQQLKVVEAKIRANLQKFKDLKGGAIFPRNRSDRCSAI